MDGIGGLGHADAQTKRGGERRAESLPTHRTQPSSRTRPKE
jgi:hypothetical protein